jgi:hypothetical protein
MATNYDKLCKTIDFAGKYQVTYKLVLIPYFNLSTLPYIYRWSKLK